MKISESNKDTMRWSQPTIERRENTCFNCDLFLGGACDGFDEDIKACADYADCWGTTKE